MAEVVWRLAAAGPAAARALAQGLAISPVAARVLCARGLADPDKARAFLAPLWQPAALSRLPGLGRAAEILRAAARRGRRIVVYGDYDVDGIAGTTVLRDALIRCWRGRAGRGDRPGLFDLDPAAAVDHYVPNRFAEGYGLNAAAVTALADRGAEVLVTVDCGITAQAEVQLARQLGLQVIITDHHLPDGSLPAADAIVNPWLDEDPALGGPCGALVALALAQELLGEARPEWLDLVALATVADIVPLVGLNRGLVHSRLPLLAKTTNPGLRSLIKCAGLAERRLGAYHLAYGLAPRINALGRVADAGDAVRAFSTADPAEADRLAAKMEGANRQRKAIEADTYAGAMAQLGAAEPDDPALPRALVMAAPDWSPGVIGIVAARLARRFWRPAAVISLAGDVGRGSARTVPGYDIYQALADCRDLLSRFGGHARAAGFTLPAAALPRFGLALARAVAAQGDQPRAVDIDALVKLAEVDERAVADLARFEPTGSGNPQPALCAPACEVVAARAVGDGSHLKLAVRAGNTYKGVIGFGLAAECGPVCRPGSRVDLVFSAEMNEYRGKKEVQLRLLAARAAAEPGQATYERTAADLAKTGGRI